MNEIIQSYAEEIRQRETARGTALFLQNRGNPEAAAEAVRVGSALNIPPIAAYTQPDRFGSELETRQAAEIFEASPRLREWVESDPLHAALSADDLQNMAQWEALLSDNSGPNGLVNAIRRGTLQVRASGNVTGAMMAASDAAQAEQSYEDILSSLADAYGGMEMLDQLPAPIQARLRESAQIRFDMLQSMGEGGATARLEIAAEEFAAAQDLFARAQALPVSERAARFRDETLANSENTWAGAFGAFFQDPVGGAVFLAETAAETLPILAASTAATVATRNPVVGRLAMGGGSFLRESSSEALQFLQEQGVDISTPEAALAALADPALLDEAAGRGLTRGLIIASLDALSGGVAGQALLDNPGGDMVAQALAQGLLAGTGEAAAQLATDGEINPQEVVIEALAELVTLPIEVVGVGGRTGFGALRRTPEVTDLERAENTGQTALVLAELDGMVANTATRERAPDRFAQYLDRVGMEGANLYVPAADFREYAQSQALDDDALAALGIDAEELGTMEESGGMIAVPLSAYTAQIAGTDQAAWFQENAVLDPATEMSAAERAREGQALMDEALAVQQQARADELQAAKIDARVQDAVREQLREAGRTPEVADSEATLFSSFFNSMAARYGTNPFELYERFNLIIREDIDTTEGVLLQEGDSTDAPRRASIQFPSAGVDRGTTVINLFEARDLSSITHEGGHYFYEVFASLASDDAAPQQMKDDVAALQEWMGVEPGSTPSVEAHETMARGLERYVMEGKAPSLQLASVFGRFKAWLTTIYRTVRRLNVDLTPEVREVFDRMLATDEQIAAAQADMGARPMFGEAPVGMEQGAWEAYQRLERQRTEQANNRMLDRAMSDIRRRREKWWKDERSALVDGQMDRLAQEPVYRLFEALANNTWIGSDQAPDLLRIDRSSLVDMGVDLASLPRGQRAIYTTQADETGMDVREAAEFFGFPDVEAMIADLQQAGKRSNRAEAEADRIMAETYPDMMDEAAIQAEALEAVHSDRQPDNVAMELRHLARRRGQDERRMRTRTFQLRARAMIGQMEVRQAINPNRFLTAERQASRRAEQAFATVARGGPSATAALADAQQAKEQQLLNHYLYLEAREVERVVSRKREEMRSYDRQQVRERVGSPHIEQIDAILSGYEFRQRSQRQVDRSMSFARYIELMDKGGIAQLPSGEEVEFTGGRLDELALDPRIVEEARRTHYTRLSVDELRGLFDTVDNIAHVGRRTREVVNARGKRLLDESAQIVAGQIRANQTLRDAPEGVGRRWQQAVNSLSRVDTIAVRMDGGQEFGQFHAEIKEQIDLAQGDEQARSVEMMERVGEVFSRHYDNKELRGLKTEQIIEGAGTWSKEQLLVLALNTGTESNFQRVMDPRVDESVRMTGDRLDRVLGTLDERDWRFVQDTWDLIDSYYTELAGVNRRMTGVDPKKVEARPMWSGAPSFVRGGYYRLFYDSGKGAGADNIAVQNLMTEGMSTGFGASAQVGNGMTQRRLQTAGGKAVRLELSGLTQQLRETVRFVTLAETINGTARILNHPEVKQAFIDTGNQDVKRTLDLWLKDIASGPIYNSDPWNAAARFAKNNFTLSRLSLNLKTVFLQTTGLTQSAVAIGPTNMARGIARYARNLTTIHNDIVAKSPFMAERMSTMQKDIYDFRDEMRTTGPVRGRYDTFMDLAAKVGFEPMVRMQFHAADVPTWLGAYEGALAEGKTEERAVYQADRMVARAQDSGLMADRSAIERGTVSETGRQQDTIRVFTTLGGYMVAKMNRANVQILKRMMQIKAEDSPALRAVIALKLAADLTVLYAAEAVIMGLMYELMDDDDEYGDLAQFVFEETGSTMVGGIPVVRDVAGAFRGFEGGIFGTVTSAPSRVYTQVNQGKLDDGLVRSTLDLVGLGTGLPSTATYRVVEQFVGEDQGSMAEALFGSNPLGR